MTTVIYLENGLCPQHRRIEQHSGRSIAALAPDWQTPFVAFVDGQPVLRADWELVLDDDRALAFVDADAIPQGGGGGSNPLRTILMIAVMIYAPQLGALMGPGMFGAGVLGLSAGAWTAGFMMVGMALVNAIAPPPKPTTPQQAAALAAPSPTYSLQAQGNAARLEAAIPEHFGRMICYPDFAAQPYAEYAGNEQHLYQLLCIGRGEYDLEGIKIEDTPIGSFDEVTTQIIAPYGQVTLFPAGVTTSLEVSGQTLSTSVVGPFVANASGTLANRLAFDFVAPRGLYYARDDGALDSRTVYINIEYATVDAFGNLTSGWVLCGAAVPYIATTTTAQRWSWDWYVPAGRYTARVSRTVNESTASREADSVVWAGLRAYHPDAVGKNYGDVTLLAVKFRASDNLSGQASRKINVIATRKLPVWNGSSWSANTATRSPAWPIAYACKQVGLSDAQIDRSGLLALATTCAARGDTFDGRFDNFLSFWEAVSKMAGSVRAKPYMQGGIMRVVRDQASTIPVALFSQRNIVKGSFSVNYLMPTDDTADSVDVGYFDDITWQSARVRSTLAGSTALKPAKVDLFGVVSRAQAHREGLYQAACNRFRRKIITFQTEMEGFIPSFGDLIAIQHDMPAWGQGGEVTAWDAGTKVLTLSEPPVFTTGTHYIALRKRDGSVDGPYACTAGGFNQVVLASTPANTPYTGTNEERTHYAFGASTTWRQPARVLSAKPQSLHLVTIEAVNEDDSVHTADTGVTMPAQVFSQLAGFQNAPTVKGVTARFLFNYPNTATANWPPTPWAEHYYVEVSIDGAGWVRVGDTTACSHQFTAPYGKSTIVRVAAVGLARGPWAQASIVVVPPFDPTGVTYAQELSGVRIKWDERLEINFYELRVGGSNWESSNLVAPVTGTEYVWAAQIAGNYTLRLKSIDVNGNYSTNAASATVVVSSPGAPEVAYALSGPDEVLSWTIPASGFTVDRYEVRMGASWVAGAFVDSAKATSLRRKVTYSGARTYWVAAVDVVGNYGSADAVSVSITAPGAVTGDRTDVIDNNALVYWGAPATGSLPVEKYEVRKGASWAAGSVIGSNGNSTFTTVFETVAGVFSYWIAAVDTAGTYGPAVSTTAQISQPPDYVLRADINSTFGGTKVNALPFEGGLLLPVNAAETWAQHFANNGYATPQAQISAGNPVYIEPGLTTASYTELIDYGSVLPATTISATLNAVPVAGTVTQVCQISYRKLITDAWINAPAGDTACVASNFQFVQVVYTFTAAGGQNLLKVAQLNIKLSIKNRSDSGTATITNATAGVLVAFGYPFIDADIPQIQPAGTVPLIPVVDYTDTPNPTSFTVYLYTLAGVKTTGSFSWSVKGY